MGSLPILITMRSNYQRVSPKEPTELCEAPIYADFWLVVDDSLCVSDIRQ